MPFDIHRRVVNKYGELDEEAAYRYNNELVALFAASPEAQTLEGEDEAPGGWVDIMLEFGVTYLGLTAPGMSARDLNEIVFQLFPQKLSTPARNAPEIIRELRAFWTFLGREFALKNAADCLKILDDRAIPKLEKLMSDPANFGMAKSIFMKGLERGFDMSTEEGINEWIATYSAETMAELQKPKRRSPFLPFSLPFSSGSPLPSPQDSLSYSMTSAERKAAKIKKNRRKAQKASRKRNRPKK